MRQAKLKSNRAVFFTALGLFGGLTLSACSPPTQETTPETNAITVFEGARLIVGDGSDPIENATFIVENANVIQVGNASDVESQPGATHVDLAGRTVMPALINAHTHLDRTEEREVFVDGLHRQAFYGVGVVMSLGSDAGTLAFEVREEVIPNAARNRTAGRGITMPEPGRSETPYWIESEEEARTAVQELAALNVDLVKIWVDDRNGQYEKLTPELYGAIIDEAHQLGLRVIAHIFALEDAKGLLRAGIDAFAHGVRDRDLDDEVVELFNENPHVIVVPNLPNRGEADDLSWLNEIIPAEELQEAQEAYTDQPNVHERFLIQARNLARLHAEGVRLSFGTDGNPRRSPHLEMVDMVAAGMDPHEVIVAATHTSAELLGLTDVGTIEVGKSADFIVLEANPLDDIKNVAKIEAVYLRGESVDRAALSTRWMGETSP